MPFTNSIGVEWAWVIPALSASAFVVVALFGRWLPMRGAFVSVAAVLLGFVLFWFVLVDLLANGGGTFSAGWLVLGDVSITWGVIVDRLSVTMIGLVTFVALLVQGLLHRVHARRAALRLVLRVPRPVRRSHARPRAGRQPRLPLLSLGARGPGVVPADRLLAREAPGGRGGQEGLRHHANRRRGAAHRHHPALPGHGHLRHQRRHPRRRERGGHGADLAGYRQPRDVPRVPGRDGQVGPVPVPRLAARRHGRARRPSAR